MRIALIILIFSVLLTFDLTAQDGLNFKQEGYLNVMPEPEVEALNNKFLYVSQNNNEVPGYRIQIMQNIKSEPVLQCKAKCARQFPQHKIYYTYDQPDFKLRIGDFTDKFEVYKALHEIRKEFGGAFIVRDMVKDN